MWTLDSVILSSLWNAGKRLTGKRLTSALGLFRGICCWNPVSRGGTAAILCRLQQLGVETFGVWGWVAWVCVFRDRVHKVSAGTSWTAWVCRHLLIFFSPDGFRKLHFDKKRKKKLSITKLQGCRLKMQANNQNCMQLNTIKISHGL